LAFCGRRELLMATEVNRQDAKILPKPCYAAGSGIMPASPTVLVASTTNDPDGRVLQVQ
jgi:hypothetical protein